ncbi:glutathione S-transferase C-terminal domain-containing protein [Rhizobium sp. C4]|uniref:glutathione S-transferase C-terminal domain-containing protein n=1 Tax=Rhizobium sp. C4 TaxID=1349800 RepID=UPI001E5ADCA9|nr:glutathione S-transferase C-terminal domain-containing protein [Rhizobium sp. C4]MCD2172764.1 glutathione S-transferase N-terminal domain-containing protein [Rhizobium sp. C4]
MIKLYGFGPGVGQPDLSPFVMKVMILLRMAGLPFEKINGIAGARKAPRGKLPYIEDKGRTVSDSRFIKRYLAEAYGVDFTGGYDEKTLMLGLLAERTLEESSYFFAVERRWIRPDGWPVMQKAAFGAMPAPVRLLIAPLVRRSVLKSLQGQGTARMSNAENDLLAAENSHAIACLLGDKPYLLGDRASASDATVLAFAIAATAHAFPGPIRDAILAEPNLVAYRNRLAAQFLPECDVATL